MTKFTKEQLQQIEAAAKEVLWPVVWSEKKAREHFCEKITPKVVLKLARIALASLEAEESGRNPVLAYADSYRDMAKQGVESIPVWSVITDLERNIAPLFTAHPASAVNAEPVAFINGAREPVLYGEHIGIAIATQLYTAPPAPAAPLQEVKQCT